MKSEGVFACREPHSAQWQLGPFPAAGRAMLIGWKLIPAPSDAGIPAAVAVILANAMTALARVTFLCSGSAQSATANWSPMGDDLIRKIEGDGPLARAKALRKGLPARMVLWSTQRPEIAQRLFEDADYPWWLQGQLVLLSKSDLPPPDLDLKTLIGLLGEDWMAWPARLEATGVLGVMRPGVDGDVAGIVLVTDRFERDLLVTLEREVRLRGLDWTTMAERDFAEALA
jgi:hypothetical protein